MKKQGKLLVVKVGTTSLTDENGGLDLGKVQIIAEQVCDLHRLGHRAVVVTSGAVAAGFHRLGYSSRPRTVPEKQASAAVGQGLLVEAYSRAFEQQGCVAAQVLLTRADFSDKRRYRNICNTLGVLIKKGAVPIINENDTVSIEELRFGDNDRLSAQVASLLYADILIILTDVAGLYDDNPKTNPKACLVKKISHIDDTIEKMAQDSESAVGTGGMASKVTAAKVAVAAGVSVLVCSANQPDAIKKAVDGSAVGSWFAPEERLFGTRLQWLAFYSESKGKILVDEGAARALRQLHASLLASGIREVQGDFECGDTVEVIDLQGSYVGRGTVEYSARELRAIIGKSSAETKEIMGEKAEEVICRDNWVGSEKMQKEGC